MVLLVQSPKDLYKSGGLGNYGTGEDFQNTALL